MPTEPDSVDIVDRLESEGLSHADALAEVRRQQAAIIAEHGWVCHVVPDARDSPTGFDAHTHNLAESYGHPDFEIVLPLTPGMAAEILFNLVAEVKAGRRFAAGDRAGGIIRGYNLGFAAATEGGRDVLRVIVPDPEGRTARGEIEEAYGVQYVGTR